MPMTLKKRRSDFARVSRRELLAGPACLIAASSLHAERAIYHSQLNVVVLLVTVSDAHGRYIRGLRPSDFRVFENGVPQRISVFAEHGKSPFSIRNDGPARLLADEEPTSDAGVPQLDLGQFNALRRDLEDSEESYTIAYHPSQPNSPGTFLKFAVQIVNDDAKLLRTKHQVGYRR
jgi:hypothetical protein